MTLDAAAMLPEAPPAASAYRPLPNAHALAEHAVAEHYIDTPEGNRLHYYESGAGRDVILIHGALVTADDSIIALQQALVPRHHIVAFDRPGHGLSTRPRAQSSLWTQAESIRDAANIIGVARPVLVGHSYGAAVAIAYAMKHPQEVAGVVAISPIAFPEPRLEHFLFGPRGLPLVGEALAATLGPLQDGLTLPLLWEAMFWPQRMPQHYRARFPSIACGRSGVSRPKARMRSRSDPILRAARCNIRRAARAFTSSPAISIW
jgi:pimeloyl-ACP methyl ester carboxylesterase